MRLAPLVLVVGLLAGCGRGSGGAVDASTVGSGETDVVIRNGVVRLPAAFPADVPIPADIAVEGADRIGEGADLFEVTGWYDGEPVPAGRAYLDELRSLGFELTSRAVATESVFFTVTDGRWTVSAGFYPDPVRERGTSVGLTVGATPTR